MKIFFKKTFFLTPIVLLVLSTNIALAQEIPLRNKMYYHLQKRQEEASNLITEGRELIKKGKKKNNNELITQGTIKLEIGKKQLKSLQEEVKRNKEEDAQNVH